MKLLAFFRILNSKHLLLAALLSLGLSLFGYLIFFQSPLLSRHEYAFTLLLWFTFTPLFYLLLSRFILPRLHEYTPHAQRNWLLISAATGFFFIFVSRPPKFIVIAEISQNIAIATSVSRLLIGFTVGFLFLVITLFLSGVQLKTAQPVKHKKGYWLLYAIPMIAVWGVYLLTFWPGIMSNDSSSQWSQLITGQFNDTHPVFHTLTMWLITRLWLSPAIVAIFQILALSLTVAWGIKILDEQGLPPWAAWMLSALFALSPVNGDWVITLWKDILYSTSLLLFSLMILKLVFSKGEWLSKKTTCVMFGLVGLCVASFRHNRLPIPILTILTLIFVYKKWWGKLVSALVLFFVLFLLIHGPLYNVLTVDRGNFAFIRFLAHHLAAHAQNENSLSPEIAKELNKIFDINDYKYDCCNQIPSALSSRGSFANPELQRQILDLYPRLAVMEPGVELEHQVCVTSFIWELPGRCSVGSFFPYSEKNWIRPKSSQIIENRQLPFLINTLYGLIVLIQTNNYFLWIITPSIYLYLSVLFTGILSFRRKESVIYLFLLPSLINSLVLMVINFTSELRLQYGVILVGMFSVGLLILSIYSPKTGSLPQSTTKPKVTGD
jgi:hypothetical protein